MHLADARAFQPGGLLDFVPLSTSYIPAVPEWLHGHGHVCANGERQTRHE